MDYTKLSLIEVSNLIHSKKVTSEEVTKQIIARIEETKKLQVVKNCQFWQACQLLLRTT